MSDRGGAERDAMRSRGEYLLYVETDACAPLQFVTGPNAPGTLSVDAIVAGIPSMTTSDQAAAAAASGFTKSARRREPRARRARPARSPRAPPTRSNADPAVPAQP